MSFTDLLIAAGGMRGLPTDKKFACGHTCKPCDYRSDHKGTLYDHQRRERIHNTCNESCAIFSTPNVVRGVLRKPREDRPRYTTEHSMVSDVDLIKRISSTMSPGQAKKLTDATVEFFKKNLVAISFSDTFEDAQDEWMFEGVYAISKDLGKHCLCHANQPLQCAVVYRHLSHKKICLGVSCALRLMKNPPGIVPPLRRRKLTAQTT